MAFFKFRKGGDASPPTPPESIETMRRRARYRLTGAAILVLAGVIGFPLLFDTQPRPIAVDIPIEIPDRNKVKPLGASPSAPVAAAVADPVIASARPVPAPAAGASDAAAARSESSSVSQGESRSAARSDERADARAEPRADSKPEARAEAKPDAKADPKSATKADTTAVKTPARAEVEATKAKALLDGKPAVAPSAAASSPAGEARYVVQVGAFADAAKAQDTRQKVERSGLKTYTHVADTKEGKRTRVRVGPFATRSEADKAAARIKGLDLPASVLTL